MLLNIILHCGIYKRQNIIYNAVLLRYTIIIAFFNILLNSQNKIFLQLHSFLVLYYCINKYSFASSIIIKYRTR